MKKIVIKNLILICLFISIAIQSQNKIIAESYDEIFFYFGQDENIQNLSKIKTVYIDDLDKYYLFVASNNDLTNVRVETGNNQISLDGKNINDGDVLSFETNHEYDCTINGNEIDLVVMQGSCKNVMYINTNSGSLKYIHENKDNKETAEILVLQDGKINYSGYLEHIKGRGNTTWELYDKKPYNIQFEDEVNILDMDESRNWCLLSNYIDRTLLKNKFMYDLAKELKSPYAPSTEVMDLYINGEYLGVYNISEKVEVSDNMVNIHDLEKYNKKLNKGVDLDNVPQGGEFGDNIKNNTSKWVNIKKQHPEYSGGYVIETDFKDRYKDEKSGFVSKLGVVNVLKEPEHATYKQVKYISDYYNDFEDALYSDDGYNYKGKYYSEYVDIDSFARMFLLQEFSKNVDVGTSSSYLVKDVGDKFVVGPIWDMDNTLGAWSNRNGIDCHDAKGHAASISKYYDMPTIFSAAYQHQDFRDKVLEIYNNEFKTIINDNIDEIHSLAKEISESAIMNQIRWDFYHTTDYEAVRANYLFYEIRDEFINFMRKRVDFMNNDLNVEKLDVIYKSNTDNSNMFNPERYAIGQEIIVSKCKYEKDHALFLSWNTKSDGSGITYYPGDIIILNSDLTLYAMWDEYSIIEIIINMFKQA